MTFWTVAILVELGACITGVLAVVIMARALGMWPSRARR